MRHRYEDDYLEARLNRALRSREGISWGTFFVGLIIGAILF